MPNIYDMYETNEKKEQNGIWFAFDPDQNAEQFLLARAGGSNKKYDMALVNKLRPYSRALQRNAKDPDPKMVQLVDDLTLEAFVETVLLDWKNVQDKTGVNIPYSPEAALELFTLPGMRQLYRDLLEHAQSVTPYKDDDEALSKN